VRRERRLRRVRVRVRVRVRARVRVRVRVRVRRGERRLRRELQGLLEAEDLAARDQRVVTWLGFGFGFGFGFGSCGTWPAGRHLVRGSGFGVRGSGFGVRASEVGRLVTVKGRVADEHLVDDDAERPPVAVLVVPG